MCVSGRVGSRGGLDRCGVWGLDGDCGDCRGTYYDCVRDHDCTYGSSLWLGLCAWIHFGHPSRLRSGHALMRLDVDHAQRTGTLATALGGVRIVAHRTVLCQWYP